MCVCTCGRAVVSVSRCPAESNSVVLQLRQREGSGGVRRSWRAQCVRDPNTHIYIYIYIYVHTYIQKHIYILTYAHTHTYIRTLAYAHTHKNTIHTHTHICTHPHTYIHRLIHIQPQVYTHSPTYTHTHSPTTVIEPLASTLSSLVMTSQEYSPPSSDWTLLTLRVPFSKVVYLNEQIQLSVFLCTSECD